MRMVSAVCNILYCAESDLRLYATRLVELTRLVKEELLTRNQHKKAVTPAVRDKRSTTEVPAFLQLDMNDTDTSNDTQLTEHLLMSVNGTASPGDLEWSVRVEHVSNFTLPPMPPVLRPVMNATRPVNVAVSTVATTSTTSTTTVLPSTTTTSSPAKNNTKTLAVTRHVNETVSPTAIRSTLSLASLTTTPSTTQTSKITVKPTASTTTKPPATTTTNMWLFTRAAGIQHPVQEPVSTTDNPCMFYTDTELISDLKQRGTYNPDLMAYDLEGILRFLRRHYGAENVPDGQSPPYARDGGDERSTEEEQATVRRNLFALEKLLKDLKVNCNVRNSETIAQLYNLTYSNGAARLRLINQTKAANDIELEMQTDYAKFVYRINQDSPLNRVDRGDANGAPSVQPNLDGDFNEVMTDGVLGMSTC